MVQVCAICYKSIPQRYKVFGGGGNATSMVQSHPAPPPVASIERPSPPLAPSTWPSAAAELCCYVCHRLSAAEAMKMLNCYPERRHLPGQRFMHFPFLKTLPTPPGPAYFDSATNRTLVCGDCFGHFNHQWQVFENDGLALELRHYTLPASIHRVPQQQQMLQLPSPKLPADVRSPATSPSQQRQQQQQIPLMVKVATAAASISTSTQSDLVQQQVSPNTLAHQRQSLLRNQPFPLAVRSTTPNANDRQSRPPSSHSNNRTPPAPTGGGSGSSTRVASPGSLSAPAQNASTDATQGPRRDNTTSRQSSSAVESSIYCYLCGLNSTRSFAHWLPSTPSVSEPATPYFPYILHYKTSSKAEKLRDDGAALVCTFCYHMVNT